MVSSVTYLQLMYACQALVCCCGGYQSVNAITNLRKYEETAQKLAEWSYTAKEHLHKTRTTQATGAMAVLASLITSTALAIGSSYMPPWLRFSASPVLLTVVLLARGHIANYWKSDDKKPVGTRIPLPNMEAYNEAERRTEEMLQTLAYLEYGWVGTSFVGGMLGKA